MISGSIQTLSPYLNSSRSEYRAQLDAQKANTLTDNSETTPAPPSSQPSPVEASPQNGSPAPVSQTNEASKSIEDRRDFARQNAAQAYTVKQQQLLIDTYQNAASQDNSSTTSGSYVEPYDAYKASLKYARRDDLLKAFETASRPDETGSEINIVI